MQIQSKLFNIYNHRRKFSKKYTFFCLAAVWTISITSGLGLNSYFCMIAGSENSDRGMRAAVRSIHTVNKPIKISNTYIFTNCT